VSNVIQSEVDWLIDTDRGIHAQSDLVVHLRHAMNQLMTCYSTTSQEHAMHLVRGMGGKIQFYFNHIEAPHSPRTMVKGWDFATWLIHLDRAISTLMEMAYRDASGQVEDQLVHILAMVQGLLVLFHGTERQGYEVSND